MITNLSFPGSGGNTLAARLDLPPAEPRAYALFAHCFTCSKESKAAAYISQALAARGIAVLRFDFASTVFSSNVEDVHAAARFLREGYGPAQILIGHSLGGAAALAAAPGIPEARAVVTIGAPFEPKHVVPVAQRAGIPLQPGFVEDLERQDPRSAIGALRKALLVLHSPRDAIVEIDNASKIFVAAKHPKSFVSLDDADHLLTRAADAAYAAEIIAAWASRFLEKTEAPAVPGVRVVEAGGSRFAQDIYAGRHRLRADEPVAVGGADSGPSPYDLLLAALGACTAMTLRIYAEQKNLPLEHVSVDLRHGKIHAADCAECETREGRVDRIERVVSVSGPLDAAQRDKLLEIANKCPVHRTLHGEVSIPTRLLPGGDEAPAA